jgi:hypothetical protein
MATETKPTTWAISSRNEKRRTPPLFNESGEFLLVAAKKLMRSCLMFSVASITFNRTPYAESGKNAFKKRT